MREQCKHDKLPEATPWPVEANLEHFMECLTPERRLELIRNALRKLLS